jgi:hypothetical protein
MLGSGFIPPLPAIKLKRRDIVKRTTLMPIKT